MTNFSTSLKKREHVDIKLKPVNDKKPCLSIWYSADKHSDDSVQIIFTTKQLLELKEKIDNYFEHYSQYPAYKRLFDKAKEEYDSIEERIKRTVKKDRNIVIEEWKGKDLEYRLDKVEEIAGKIIGKSKDHLKHKVDWVDFQNFWQDVVNILREEYGEETKSEGINNGN